MGMLDELVRRLRREGNVAAAVNVAESRGTRSSVRRHQTKTIVQRDGQSTVTTEQHVTTKEAEDDRTA